jgi:hypothetical protein
VIGHLVIATLATIGGIVLCNWLGDLLAARMPTSCCTSGSIIF